MIREITSDHRWLLLMGALAVLGILIVMGIEVTGTKPPIFSKREMLEGLWHTYKKDHLEPETLRALDGEQNNITTSEGQSYSLLRSVWMDDRTTFDVVWAWSKDNMQQEDSMLMSWLYGLREDGTYGILTVPGAANSATDADVDTALALLLAYERWQDEQYYTDARALLNDIWEEEVIVINGQPYLAANDVEKGAADDDIVINPSYFAPYAFRVFARVDTEHPWEELVDTSYNILERSTVAPLQGEGPGVLPPDWLVINRITGELTAPDPSLPLTTDYSFDAMRVPWRIAVDWVWNKDPRAEAYLRSLSFLGLEWKEDNALFIRYAHQGEVITYGETPAMYGTAIGYFMVTDPSAAERMYKRKLAPLYNPDTYRFREELPYYSANWAWFGLALYGGFITNYIDPV